MTTGNSFEPYFSFYMFARASIAYKMVQLRQKSLERTYIIAVTVPIDSFSTKHGMDDDGPS